jgi:hypothetical protein
MGTRLENLPGTSSLSQVHSFDGFRHFVWHLNSFPFVRVVGRGAKVLERSGGRAISATPFSRGIDHDQTKSG